MERSNVECSLCRQREQFPLSSPIAAGTAWQQTHEDLQKGLAGTAASRMEMLPFGEHPENETDAFAE